MKAKEFLIKYRDGLNLNGIESTLKIPKDSLRFAVNGTRSLPIKHERSIAEWFNLETPATPESSEVVWDLASNHKSTVGGYRIVNGKGQKPVLRDGVMMVRLKLV